MWQKLFIHTELEVFLYIFYINFLFFAPRHCIALVRSNCIGHLFSFTLYIATCYRRCLVQAHNVTVLIGTGSYYAIMLFKRCRFYVSCIEDRGVLIICNFCKAYEYFRVLCTGTFSAKLTLLTLLSVLMCFYWSFIIVQPYLALFIIFFTGPLYINTYTISTPCRYVCKDEKNEFI